MNGKTWGFVLLTIMPAFSAEAHHSFATFDVTQKLELVGTVKEFQWTNPHTWIYITVPTDGQPVDWEIEGGPVIGLKRDGWTHDSLKAGDKITLTIHPKRDGSHGGSFVQVITADGKTLGHPDMPVYTKTPKPKDPAATP